MAWNNRENNSQNPNDKTPVIDCCITAGTTNKFIHKLRKNMRVVLTLAPYVGSVILQIEDHVQLSNKNQP